MPDFPVGQNIGPIVYVPELGGLVHTAETYSGVFLYKTGTWSSLGSVSGLVYHNFAEYNPIHKVTVFGGGNGSSKMYKLSATGKITPLNDAPLELTLPRMEFTVDPVRGEYLVLQMDKSFRAYDVLTDTWRALSAPPGSLWGKATE